MFELKLNKPQASKPQPVKKVNKLFEGAMDETPVQDSKPKLTHHFAEMSKKSYDKMLDDTSKLIVEDPTIFSYDAHYDDYQEKRKEIEQQKRQKTGPKHIQNIQKAVEKRKIEQTMIYEKIEGKKLQREGENAGGQVYVTKKYKQTMEEGRKFLEEDEAKEKYNQTHSGENQDNLYKNLYKQDIFMGGYRPDLSNMIKQDKNPAPQPPEQTVQQAQKPEQPVQNITKPLQEERPEYREQKGSGARAKGELSPERKEREVKRHAVSKSRSRSRSRSPTRLSALREEAKVHKDEPEKEVEKEKEKEQEKEKELTKEEKLKLAKERYMQRKLGQAAGPNTEQA